MASELEEGGVRAGKEWVGADSGSVLSGLLAERLQAVVPCAWRTARCPVFIFRVLLAVAVLLSCNSNLWSQPDLTAAATQIKITTVHVRHSCRCLRVLRFVIPFPYPLLCSVPIQFSASCNCIAADLALQGCVWRCVREHGWPAVETGVQRRYPPMQGPCNPRCTPLEYAQLDLLPILCGKTCFLLREIDGVFVSDLGSVDAGAGAGGSWAGSNTPDPRGHL
eukprot:3766047-Rhodomonas_salina.4